VESFHDVRVRRGAVASVDYPMDEPDEIGMRLLKTCVDETGSSACLRRKMAQVREIYLNGGSVRPVGAAVCADAQKSQNVTSLKLI
jgi:hypothetical protein